MVRNTHILATVFAALFCSSAAVAHPITLESLTNDIARSELGRLAAQLAEPGSRGVGPAFRLPENANASYTYGIDISHHNFSGGQTLDWGSFAAKKVSFVYMKATQGSGFVDSTLARNWKGIDDSNAKGGRLLKGAYHFLSADIDAAAQARTFVATLRTLTTFDESRDLPPCLDLEWDFQSVQGRVVRDLRGNSSDRWQAYRPQEIMRKVATWLRIVRSELGVTPLIYTNAQWWNGVGLGQTWFENRPKLWVADYSKRANASFKPGVPTNQPWLLWQFTDSVNIDGEEYDGNIYPRDAVSFAADIGLAKRK